MEGVVPSFYVDRVQLDIVSGQGVPDHILLCIHILCIFFSLCFSFNILYWWPITKPFLTLFRHTNLHRLIRFGICINASIHELQTQLSHFYTCKKLWLCHPCSCICMLQGDKVYNTRLMSEVVNLQNAKLMSCFEFNFIVQCTSWSFKLGSLRMPHATTVQLTWRVVGYG